MLLPVTMATAYTLLDSLGIPRKIVVHDQGAELEIDALCSRFRGNHDSAFLAEVVHESRTHISGS